jgi:hypothetical protein
MASKKANNFLNSPTELRLQVYKELFVDCLASSDGLEIAGLYLCCRTIQTELDREYGQLIGPLLTTKHLWKKIDRQAAPLRITVEKQKKILVEIPVSDKWLSKDNSFIWHESFNAMSASLRPVLSLSWDLVELSFFKPDSTLIHFDTLDLMFNELFYIDYRTGRAPLVLPRTARLQLHYTASDLSEQNSNFDAMQEIWAFYRGLPECAGLGWLCGESGDKNRMSLVIDLSDQLEPEGATWRLKTDVAECLLDNTRLYP